MTIRYSKRFRKQFKKLRPKEKDRFWQRLELLKTRPYDKRLNNHLLSGDYAHMHSINIGGDLRALFSEAANGQIIIFELIGTHAQLYG
ncbi:MAG: type II toxin-antitoxin system RelE/ParE family toxin [Candidatus Saccharimonadales bacterium]